MLQGVYNINSHFETGVCKQLSVAPADPKQRLRTG
jgi:hypothetical protein